MYVTALLSSPQKTKWENNTFTHHYLVYTQRLKIKIKIAPMKCDEEFLSYFLLTPTLGMIILSTTKVKWCSQNQQLLWAFKHKHRVFLQIKVRGKIKFLMWSFGHSDIILFQLSFQHGSIFTHLLLFKDF